MSYLPSKNVKVFPFGSPRTSDPSSRILNEQNIVRLTKSLVDKESYVLDYNAGTGSASAIFVIAGYYFECVFPNDETITKPLFANIKIVSDSNYSYLSGGDSQDEFSGVYFSSKEALTEGYTHCLQILDSNGTVPKTSLVKFNNSSIENKYKLIDCGSATEVIN